jgi:predicted nucleotidyltransferase
VGTQPQGGTDERLDLLDAVVYGDLFDCAVTLEELWRYARIAIARDELRRRLRDDPGLGRIAEERGGFYHLAGRGELPGARAQRIERARRLRRRARRVARVLRHCPFTAGLVLTGSVSADDAREDADVDLLVIVTPGRLGTVFAVLASVSRLTGRRLFCPNWYVAENALAMAPRSPYLARELAQSCSLTGNADTLRDANPWIAQLFPNASAPRLDPALARRTRVRRALEAPLEGPLGERVERWAQRVAGWRLSSHYAALGQRVPAEVAASFEAGLALRFHGYRYEERTSAAYAARRAELARRLERADRVSADGRGRVEA